MAWTKVWQRAAVLFREVKEQGSERVTFRKHLTQEKG